MDKVPKGLHYQNSYSTQLKNEESGFAERTDIRNKHVTTSANDNIRYNLFQYI